MYGQNGCQLFYHYKVDKQTRCHIVSYGYFKQDTPKPIKSFDQYRKNKEKKWKTKCQNNKVKPKEEEMTIAIGLLEWKEKRLKPVRGQRIALRVSNNAPYAEILSKAVKKWKAHHSDLYIEDEEYFPVFESGKEAQVIPGTVELFTLSRYQEEIGKDYKRIVLYLCSRTNVNSAEHGYGSSVSEYSAEECKAKRAKLQIKNDEESARDLQFEFDKDINAGQFVDDGKRDGKSSPDVAITSSSSEVSVDVKILEDSSIPCTTATNNATEPACHENHPILFLKCEDLLRSLASGLDDSDQFFLVIRRGSSLQRQLKIWKRESNRKSPEKFLRVHFAGEDGIDTGGMAQQFFANALKNIGREFFPNGSLMDSMLHIQNGFFLVCGQIVAVSLTQGGPPPQFLNDLNYNLLVNPQQDLSVLQPDVHLTDHERASFSQVSEDPVGHQDDILQYGYTGIIH